MSRAASSPTDGSIRRELRRHEAALQGAEAGTRSGRIPVRLLHRRQGQEGRDHPDGSLEDGASARRLRLAEADSQNLLARCGTFGARGGCSCGAAALQSNHHGPKPSYSRSLSCSTASPSSSLLVPREPDVAAAHLPPGRGAAASGQAQGAGLCVCAGPQGGEAGLPRIMFERAVQVVEDGLAESVRARCSEPNEGTSVT
jgi:hypothetical protein